MHRATFERGLTCFGREVIQNFIEFHRGEWKKGRVIFDASDNFKN